MCHTDVVFILQPLLCASIMCRSDVVFILQPLLCEIMVTIKEYTKTVMFVWMFIEGMYLHNMLIVSVFSGKSNFVLYFSLGWGK